MTKEETIKLMATINAFYAGGKNDPRAQANAWYLVLKDYNYDIAFEAVIEFARNDRREYATYPAVGSIVAEIEKLTARKMKPVKELLIEMQYGTPYERLSADAQYLISEKAYKEMLALDCDLLRKKIPEIRRALINKNLLTGGQK